LPWGTASIRANPLCHQHRLRCTHSFPFPQRPRVIVLKPYPVPFGIQTEPTLIPSQKRVPALLAKDAAASGPPVPHSFSCALRRVCKELILNVLKQDQLWPSDRESRTASSLAFLVNFTNSGNETGRALRKVSHPNSIGRSPRTSGSARNVGP
jgi:hypothetical protein